MPARPKRPKATHHLKPKKNKKSHRGIVTKAKRMTVVRGS